MMSFAEDVGNIENTDIQTPSDNGELRERRTAKETAGKQSVHLQVPGRFARRLNRAYHRAMSDFGQREIRQRLDPLAPSFRDLGARTLEIYADAGIPEAVAGGSFPISDALFTHKQGRYVYHPHGPVYLYVTRGGELQLAGQAAEVPFVQALADYVQLVRPGDLDAVAAVEGATEWFPPPRFLLDGDSSRLYIASVSSGKLRLPHPGFQPLEDYVDDRAQLFVRAFRNSQ